MTSYSFPANFIAGCQAVTSEKADKAEEIEHHQLHHLRFSSYNESGASKNYA